MNLKQTVAAMASYFSVCAVDNSTGGAAGVIAGAITFIGDFNPERALIATMSAMAAVGVDNGLVNAAGTVSAFCCLLAWASDLVEDEKPAPQAAAQAR